MSTTFGWREVAGADTRGARVLIVDDNPDVRQQLRRAVTHLGYTGTATSSAENADRLLAETRFDVALLDIELPRMSGVEFLGWALARDPEMPVIMLTGVDVPEVAIECLEAGARTYLVKPVELDFLKQALRDAVALRRVLVGYNECRASRG